MINFLKNSLLPSSILIASVMGAGMFSLPFVFHTVGLLATIIYLILFGMLAVAIHLIYADVVMRAHEKHLHFPGYIKLYLGDRIGMFATFVVLITLLFTLTAFLILSTSFLHILIPTLQPLSLLFLFWALGTLFAFITIEGTGLFDAVTTTLTLAAIAAIFIYWGTSIAFDRSLLPTFNASQSLLPFGPALFSFLGFSAIPALIAYARKQSIPMHNTQKAIILGSLIPAFFYLLFVVAIWGLSPFVSIDSVSGLIANIPASIMIIFGILGFVSLWDSYASVGRDASKLIHSELNLPTVITFFVVALAPLALFFLGFQNFITIIDVIGGILFSIWGILIILAWKKAVAVRIPSVKFSAIEIPDHPETITDTIPPFVPNILLVIFFGGIVYEVVSLVI